MGERLEDRQVRRILLKCETGPFQFVRWVLLNLRDGSFSICETDPAQFVRRILQRNFFTRNVKVSGSVLLPVAKVGMSQK